jgi:hypothetical protein
MNKGLEINILFHNDETKRNKQLDIEFDYRHLDVVPFYLTNCDGFHPVINCDNEYTEIYIGGSTIICILEYQQFKTLFHQVFK